MMGTMVNVYCFDYNGQGLRRHYVVCPESTLGLVVSTQKAIRIKVDLRQTGSLHRIKTYCGRTTCV